MSTWSFFITSAISALEELGSLISSLTFIATTGSVGMSCSLARRSL